MKTEIKGKYKGFNFKVVAQPMGYRCGYVRIPKGHVIYGMDYSEQLPITFKEISKQSVGKRGAVPIFLAQGLKENDRVSMDLLFDVHGGITFAGKSLNWIGFKSYWIGFDCAHAGDGKDTSIMDEKNKRFHKVYSNLSSKIRTKEYVEKECKSLINQIKKYFK